MSNTLRTLLFGCRQTIRNAVVPKRNISQSLSRHEKSPVTVAADSAAKENPMSKTAVTHIVKPYQKYVLVWTGKYKSRAEIPERVSHAVLDSALNKARVKLSIYMMIATALMAGAAIYSGKQAAHRGEHLAKTGLEYQKKLQEEGVREREAAEAAAAAASTSSK